VRVKDINPGAASSFLSGLVNLNGKLFFAATDGSNGFELWTSDGSPAGTVLVKDIYPGSAGSLDGTWLTNVNGTLYFAAADPTSYGLWQSDGTAAGTKRVPDLYGERMFAATDLLNVGGSLFFTASLPATSVELLEVTPDPAGVTATPDGVYSFAGLGSNKVLTVTSGTVTLSTDLSAQYPGASVSLDASNGATVVFTAEQHLANISLSGGASIVDDSGNQPPAGGGGSSGSVATPPPTPTPTSTPTPTPTPGPPQTGGTLALAPTAGGYVRDGAYAGTGFANDPSLVVKKGLAGYNREAYLTFDLSRVTSIRSAKLRLYGQSSTAAGAGVPVRVFAAPGALPKGKMTWKNRPGAAGAPLASATVTGTAGRWYEWDLTAFLKAQKAAGHNLGTIALQAAVATDAAAIFQRGHPGPASRTAPQLVVT
jgi:ELWxxDGT repeat protein